jgi:hypothetical protein
VTSTYRRHLHFGDFAIVVFVVQTIAEDIPKRLETPLDPVRDRFLLGLGDGERQCILSRKLMQLPSDARRLTLSHA